MSCQNNKLIILRGPSGSGKTTIAKILFESTKDKSCLIQQDYYRFIFNPCGGGSKPNSSTIHQMIEDNTITALKDGYNVILEGILSVRSYEHVIDQIISNHSGPSYIFYFNVSLEETFRRHQQKPEKYEISTADMAGWYEAAHRSNHELEYIIEEEFSKEETISYILSHCGTL